MKIGLVYDLRKDYLEMGLSEEETAEFDSENTIDELSGAIESLGYKVDRIGNIMSLTSRLAQGERWELVFTIAEGLNGRSREAQVPALLEAFGIPYTFSDPLTLALALDKAMTKRVLRDHGIPTPWFVLMEDQSDLERPVDPPTWPLFVKPVSEGTGKGVDERSIVSNPEELKARCRHLLERYRQPVLVEAYLPGREFTVGILGTGPEARAVGVLEVKLLERAEREVYSYVNKEQCEELVEYVLITDPAIVEEASRLSVDAYRALGCRDAGRIDVRANADGVLEVIELNPLAGLNPLHSDLPILCTKAGIPYNSLIGAIVESASKRIVQQRVALQS
jgi:D-alanine-D-alanine ligase